ncbi:hypothetical protein HMPREF3213_01675 [Heyndrickxia coagulans]|uniref:Uncharacterized protein n=1 Tax=Heyndrickxia coagulans TaxID=1398 RepID=A0A133KSV2_HEYCO|nr:hypothetical protein HMPREF3213_01675 [Heyndrickxia coagulans]
MYNAKTGNRVSGFLFFFCGKKTGASPIFPLCRMNCPTNHHASILSLILF